ncbi:hypothetical protein HDU97_008486 [Phlyctochytrium planicorne]|nr:hypothetical protein HDU97_008486 [Phlyctochytrium planicorne]
MSDQKKLFDILTALKSLNGQTTTFSALQKQVQFKLSETQVWRNNDKIGFDIPSKTIWYKHQYTIQTKQEFLEILQKTLSTGGADVRELKESCPDIYTMCDELEKSGDIFLIRNKDDTPRLAYYNCMNDHTGDEPAKFPSSEFTTYWEQETIPTDEDALLKELEAAGLRKMDGSGGIVKKKAVAKVKSKRGRRIKITNTHLEGVDLTKEWSASKGK